MDTPEIVEPAVSRREYDGDREIEIAARRGVFFDRLKKQFRDEYQRLTERIAQLEHQHRHDQAEQRGYRQAVRDMSGAKEVERDEYI